MSDDTTQTLSERAIVDAKHNLDTAIEEFTRSQRLGQENILIASERLHTAVVGLWWRMRAHLRNNDGWDDISEIEGIDLDNIYSGQHPQTGQDVDISGLKDIEGWIDRSMTVHEDVSGPNQSLSSSKRQQSVRLPASAAINAAKALSTKFHDFGWDAQADQGLPGQKEFDPAGEKLERKDKSEIV